MAGLIIEQMIRRAYRLRLIIPAFAVIAAIILALLSEQIIVHGFAALMFISIPVSGLFITVQDYSNKWYKYEKLLPVSDGRIILSKVCCYIIDVVVAFILGAVFFAVSFHIDSSLFDFGWIDAFSILVALLTIVSFIGAVFYGCLYIIGERKSDIWAFISILSSLVATGAIMMALNKTGVEKITGLIIMLCCSLLSLVVACAIASKFYRKDRS